MSKPIRIVTVGITLLVVYAGATGLAQDGQQAGEQIASSIITPQTVRVFTGQQHVFKRVLTEDVAAVLNPGPIAADGFSAYLNVPGAGPANGAVGVVAGQASLINVRFTAESQCAAGGTDAGWCGVRILVDGVEAHPAPADFAFDSTNNGADGFTSWEGHAMERHLCLRNPTGAVRAVPVQVQWRVFAGADGIAPEFRLDDWSLAIETALAPSCP